MIWRLFVKSLNDLTKWRNSYTSSIKFGLKNQFGSASGEDAFDTKILPGVGEGQTMNDSFKRIGKQLQAARKERGLADG